MDEEKLPHACNYCHRKLRTLKSRQLAATNGGYGPVCVKKVRAKQAAQAEAIAARLANVPVAHRFRDVVD